MTHLTQISHVVMSHYWLLIGWNLSLSPVQLRSGQESFVPFFNSILCTLRFTHMQSLTDYFFISLKHLCLFCVICIRPLIHYEIVTNKLRELLPTKYQSWYNLCNSHKYNYKVSPVRTNRAKNLFILSMCGWINPSHNSGSSDVFAWGKQIVHHTPLA